MFLSSLDCYLHKSYNNVECDAKHGQCEVIPLKPFAMEYCAHFSRSSLPSFASITGCSAMHKLKLLRLSDMNKPNPAILSVSGSEHDKKWLRHETHQDLCVLQRLY
jgi:hypothetical protein